MAIAAEHARLREAHIDRVEMTSLLRRGGGERAFPESDRGRRLTSRFVCSKVRLRHDQRLGEIETAIAAIEERPASYDPADIARAGAFVSIDGSGRLRMERGYVRPEDEAPIEETDITESGKEIEANASSLSPSAVASKAVAPNSGAAQSEPAEDEDEGLRPLPDKLLTELTAYRTLALREAIGNDPGVAFLAALHVLCLKLFYH